MLHDTKVDNPLNRYYMQRKNSIPEARLEPRASDPDSVGDRFDSTDDEEESFDQVSFGVYAV